MLGQCFLLPRQPRWFSVLLFPKPLGQKALDGGGGFSSSYPAAGWVSLEWGFCVEIQDLARCGKKGVSNRNVQDRRSGVGRAAEG